VAIGFHRSPLGSRPHLGRDPDAVDRGLPLERVDPGFLRGVQLKVATRPPLKLRFANRLYETARVSGRESVQADRLRTDTL
jgi:hypothetical protein